MKRILPAVTATALALTMGTVLTPTPAQAASPVTYSVRLLPPASGHQETFAQGLNNRGDVVGYSVSRRSGSAVVWKVGSSSPSALAISDDRAALDIADDQTLAGISDEMQTAFVSRGGASKELRAEELVIVSNLSNTGLAAVTTMDADDEGIPYLLSTTQARPLPLMKGDTYGLAARISTNGRHVAGSSGERPVIWTDGTPRAVQAPGGDAFVTAVNDKGESVGCDGRTGLAWDAAGRMRRLRGEDCPTLFNNSGAMAGLTANSDGDLIPAVWVDAVARDLNSMVPGRSGYTLMDVSDINERGQLVGTAELANGTQRGFIATPSNQSTVYTTAGTHDFNGRRWSTTCQPYSRTIRCRTDIWSKQVVLQQGKYVVKQGWFFNNLTYLPFMTRAQWGTNPLARAGQWTNGGRQYKTECDTAATGKGACRSYIWGTTVQATRVAPGKYAYKLVKGWVFNNIVQFKA